jgi:hypothetical protein
MSKATTQSRRKSAAMKSSAAGSSHPVSGGVALSCAIKDSGVKPAEAFSTPQRLAVRTKTLRLEPTFERGLVLLKGVLKKPINKMVNEAVGEYIQRRTAQVESELTTTLEDLQAYRRSDPEFLAARQAFIDAEALYGRDDPMQGRVVQVVRPEGVPPAARYVSRTKASSGDTATDRFVPAAQQRS